MQVLWGKSLLLLPHRVHKAKSAPKPQHFILTQRAQALSCYCVAARRNEGNTGWKRRVSLSRSTGDVNPNEERDRNQELRQVPPTVLWIHVLAHTVRLLHPVGGLDLAPRQDARVQLHRVLRPLPQDPHARPAAARTGEHPEASQLHLRWPSPRQLLRLPRIRQNSAVARRQRLRKCLRLRRLVH